MTTSIGTFLRRLRIEKNEILKDMAENLGVSSAFLSAVENGKKKFPETWTKKLQEIYALSPEKVDELKDAVMKSAPVVETNIEGASEPARQLAVTFARNFDSIDDEMREKIMKILTKNKR